MSWPVRLAPSAVALLCAACAGGAGTTTAPPSNPSPPSADAPAKNSAGGVWAGCFESFTPAGSARGDLARLTRSCGPTGGMRAVTPVTVAKQTDKDPVDRYTFYVPKAGACYRVYAVGDRSVQDLDLLVRGPSGDDVAADVSHDAFPVLPPTGPLCFDTAGLYQLEVSVYSGGGEYAVQVWGNPDGVGNAASKP